MLLELAISNLAIIEDLHLTFQEGFTALTGETGAGKSILINALKMILGEKVRADLIRRGQDQLKVEAIFNIPPVKELHNLLAELELDLQDNEIILEREVFKSGKTRARVNGTLISITNLAKISCFLIDLHGQHPQQSLLQSSTHLGFIDHYGGLGAQVQKYTAAYSSWRAGLKALEELIKQAEAVKEQQDFFSYQLKELTNARLKNEEEEELENKVRVLASLEHTTEHIHSCLNLLEGNGGLIEASHKLLEKLTQLEKHITAFKGLPGEVENVIITLREALSSISGYEIPREVDDATLDSLNGRIAFLQRLKSKYKLDIAGLLALRDKRQEALDNLNTYSDDQQDLKNMIEDDFNKLCLAGKALSVKRKEAGGNFAREVCKGLASLAMDGADFRCSWQELKPIPGDLRSVSSTGLDKMEFHLSANPGEDLKPLHHVASGGEVSRVMLALKAALAEHDLVPLLVFDEIDTGIGGHTANRIGETLKALSSRHQVIVITHLHQVAAHAANQIKVTKSTRGGLTRTAIQTLNTEERVEELARMLGDNNSEPTLKHARSLLQKSRI